MSLARSLERRIEQLVEGLGSKVFRGRLQPVEVAIRVVREAEMSLVHTGVGPSAPNHFMVSVNPADLGEDAGLVVSRLNRIVGEAADERGWRLEGPPSVAFQTRDDVTAGSVQVESDIRPGPLEPWGQLLELHGLRRIPISKNRSLIGRSRHADIMLGDDSVSRTHCLLWHDAGGCWIQDLASSNGTRLNGFLTTDAAALQDGDVITVGTAKFSFRRV